MGLLESSSRILIFELPDSILKTRILIDGKGMISSLQILSWGCIIRKWNQVIKVLGDQASRDDQFCFIPIDIRNEIGSLKRIAQVVDFG